MSNNIELSLCDLVAPIVLGLHANGHDRVANSLQTAANWDRVDLVLRHLDTATGEVAGDFAKGAINTVRVLVETIS